MAIKIKPDYAEAYSNLGGALFHAKMTEEAIDYFKKTIRIQPGFAAATLLRVTLIKYQIMSVA